MNFKTKEKGNVALLMIIVLVIVGASGYLFYRYRSSDALVADLSKRLSGKASTQKVANSSSSAAFDRITKSSDNSKTQPSPTSTPVSSTKATATTPTTFYYRGKVLNTAEDALKWYTVTLQPQDENGKNSGSVITFKLPAVGPRTNRETLGSNLKEMVNKGFNPISIKVVNNENGRFNYWESLTTNK